MNNKITTIEIQPKSDHKFSVIWLHGLGADGHDFEGIVDELQLHNAENIHFIFPNAPVQSVTINGGMHMRAWYDILDATLNKAVDIAGIYQSAQLIESLIQQEQAAGIPAERILLAGFSQGGVIALHTGLTYPAKLAGIIALSTYLPTVEQLTTQRSTTNQSMPLFMGHGILDPVVPIELAKAALDALEAMAYSVEWHDYLMKHSLCIEEIHHISAFINTVFSQA